MKNRLRLALPPLDRLSSESVIPFALFDHTGRLLRSGELPLHELAASLPTEQVQAILHPGDAIVLSVTLPPVPKKQLYAAVQSSVEPMALSDIGDLCIAHGPQAADGSVYAVWTDKRALLKAWRLSNDAGLNIAAIVPLPLALPTDDPHPDLPLTLPANERWLAPLPRWSLARPEWRPDSQTHRWRRAGQWACAAALLWLFGVQIYAAQLRGEANALRANTEQAVRSAFPGIPLIVDPLQQARGQRDMLRRSVGVAAEDDFMPLALGASKVLNFASGYVASLHYENNKLTLVLAEGYTPPANEAALMQAAAVQSLVLQKDEKAAHTWHVQRADVQKARP